MDRKFMRVFSDSDFWIKELSHEMRTPLYSILLLSEDLKRQEGLSDDVRKKTCQIRSSADHLLAIVNNVLDLTKISEGRCVLNSEPFDLKDLMNEVTQILSPSAKERKIRIRMKFASAHENYEGDALKLKQIFINILSNAIRYSRDKGRVLFIAKAIENREEEDLLRFVIADEGCGIERNFIDRIFDPYTQEKEKIGTSGLGLYITKAYVDMMGGKIFLSSRKGKGTTFLIEIPLKTGKKNIIKEQGPDLRGMRILVAEDVLINARIIENLLRNHGAETKLAENGKTALEMYEASEEGHYDVLILDVRMPVLGGRDAAEKIRACKRKDSGIPIIALSGECSGEEIEESQKAGIDVHLCKPVDPEKLLKTIGRLCLKKKD
ncbi:MAG: response regulator [Erysipelotrichaceae bacterium]|nr:response regulator [Erysipelotrichaceae bacterium]